MIARLGSPARPFALIVGGLFLLVLLVACQKNVVDRDSNQATREAQSSYAGAVPAAAFARLGKGSINALAFSADGRQIAAGSDVGLYLYDAETLAEIWKIPVTSSVISTAFSPDGDLLASGSKSGSVSLINTAAGLVLTSTSGKDHDDNGVYSIAWTDGPAAHDGLLLAVGFNDGVVVISRIDMTQGEKVQELNDSRIEVIGSLERQAGGVTAMAYNATGKVLATGNRSGVINLWDAETLQWFGALRDETRDSFVSALDWSPDGDRLVTGSANDGFAEWDVLTFQPVHRLGQAEKALSVAYAPDGLSFASADKDGTIIYWDAEEPETKQSAGNVGSALAAFAWSPDRQKYATASDDGTLAVWSQSADPADAQQLARLDGHAKRDQWVVAEAWSPDGDLLAAGLGPVAILWDPETIDPIRLLQGHKSLVTSVAWSPDGEELATGSRDQTIIIWDPQTGEAKRTLRGHQGLVADLDWSPDGRWLVSTGSLDDTAILWDPESGEARQTLPGTGSGVWSAAWSPDSEALALGTTLGEILIWETTDVSNLGQAPARILRRHLNWVAGLDFSPDGRFLASAGADSRVVVTDLENDQARNFAGHSGPVRRVAFSPDGRLLASASRDGSVIIWDADPAGNGEPISILEGHVEGVNDVDWSPDGQLLASGSDDSTVLLWDTATK